MAVRRWSSSRRSGASALIAAFILTGCDGEAESNATRAAALASGDASFGLKETSCRPLEAHTPGVGDTFLVRSQGPGGEATGAWRYTITAVEDDVVKAETQIEGPGGEVSPGPPVAYIAGVIPATAGEGSPRSFRFPANAADRVRDLRVGDTLTLPGSETSTLFGSTKTIQGQLEVTLVGCGTLPVSGRREPVHVYDVVDFRRSIMPSGDRSVEGVRRNRIRSYVSDRLGWEIGNEASGGAMAPAEMPVARSG